MPPAESSRSRTYFPKAWGNKARAHRSVVVAASLGCACTTIPGAERTHEIRPHFLKSCAPATVPDTTEFDLEAQGDFAPSARTEAVLHQTTANDPLAVPAKTLAVTVHASTGFADFDGAGAAAGDGSIDVSLWPEGAACPLFSGDPTNYPGNRGGQAIGVSPDSRVLLVAGAAGENPIASGAFTVDLGTGDVENVSPDFGLRERRASATVTPFGDDLLVAGGGDSETGTAIASAEVFDVASRHFELDTVALQSARAHHAAVTLLTGETLLVGGIDAQGNPLKTLEAVSPDTRRYRISGLAELHTPRVDPIAVRLSDGRVLVAGGTTGGAANAPIASLEWISANGSEIDDQIAILPAGATATTTGRAFVAMPGGGALAAGGCDARSATNACDAPAHAVFWITKEGAVDPLPDLEVTAVDATFVAGDEGRPWLVADAPGGGSVFLRFDPWTGGFETVSAPLPPRTSEDASQPAPHYFVADSGSFGWLALDDAGNPVVSGFRHGTRGPFVQAVAPLLLTGTDGLSPDRPAQTQTASPDSSRATELLADGGGVELGGPAALSVTDATYADVRVVVRVADGAAPLIQLGASTFGGANCAWPPASSGATDFDATLARAGKAVTLTLNGASRTCPGPDGRVGVSLASSSGLVTIRSISVTRSGSP